MIDPQEIHGLESDTPIHLCSMCFGRRSAVKRGIRFSEVVFARHSAGFIGAATNTCLIIDRRLAKKVLCSMNTSTRLSKGSQLAEALLHYDKIPKYRLYGGCVPSKQGVVS